MNDGAYYNENDEFAVAWLRNLIAAKVIAKGEVDARSIVDVRPSDLVGFRQCHFFAGIGVWSHALRSAGWPDERAAWTGSCPCGPFSIAGQKRGFADDRHLWPNWYPLIAECCPDIVFGEQVASKDGLAWLDLVQSDLEAAGYAVGAVDLCAAGFGAPHIRQRLYWVALGDATGARCDDTRQRDGGSSLQPSRPFEPGNHDIVADPSSRRSRTGLRNCGATGLGRLQPANDGANDIVGVTGIARLERHAGDGDGAPGRQVADRSAPATGATDGLGDTVSAGWTKRGTITRDRPASGCGATGILGDAGRDGARQHAGKLSGDEGEHEVGAARRDHAPDAASAADLLADTDMGRRAQQCQASVHGDGAHRDDASGRGPVNGPWRDADWLFCRDGRWRPVRPGSFPLAHDAANRVGRLRGYGNALVAPVAQAFIEAVMECMP